MRLRMMHTATGRPSLAVWREDGWVPLVGIPEAEALGNAAHELLAFLAGGEPVRARAEELAEKGSPEGASPAPGLPYRPTAFRDCLLWEEHHIAAARRLLRLQPSAAAQVGEYYERLTRRTFPSLRPRPLWYEQPIYYKGNPATFLGDGETVRWPAYAQALDYELEIGFIVARDVSDVSGETALEAIGGFVLLNDFTARDLQVRELREARLGLAKTKDFGTALGPVVVTPDEFLPLLPALDAEVRVNGEVWGTGNTRGMQHSVADVIAQASLGEVLAAGEVIGLGTVPGCSGVEVDRWLSPGDVVAVSAGPLGTLGNTIGQPEPWRQRGPARRARWSVVLRSGDTPDPSGIQPLPWTPPPAPALEGALAPNQLLDDVQRWEVPGGIKPEDVVFDATGRLYAGVEDGRIWRWPAGFPDFGEPELFADTHGRPLGLEIDPRDGSLLVCDAYRGLLRVADNGDIEMLAESWAGRRLRFPNNAAVAADGAVYFSDSSTRFGIEHYSHDLLEHRATGRVFCFRPGSGRIELLAEELYFPNGVALAPDESFLLVAQTGCYNVLRIPLTRDGPGKPVPFTENLPGFPDNMSPVGDGSYWVALSPRLPRVDRLMPRPALRRAVVRLPERLRPSAQHYGLVVRIDATGRIVQSLHGPSGSYAEIVGVRQHGDWLYLGSLFESAVGRVRLPR